MGKVQLCHCRSSRSGLVLAQIIIFFSVQYSHKTVSWWGNNVPYEGYDARGIPLKNINGTNNGYFGPSPGNYP